MKKKFTIKDLIKIAEDLGWEVTKEDFGDNQTGYQIAKFSSAGQDFCPSLESGKEGEEKAETLIESLENYIEGYNPFEEAQLWVRNGHGHNGAPDDPMDVIKDMEECKHMMQELLSAWKEDKKQSFTIYRVIRIDGQFDTSKNDSVNNAVEAAVNKVINDALAHRHTIEDGIEITDVTDCGESI